ncbi:MAG: Uma2 family endonuclease [Planctomycetaceae bacterium]
MIANNRMTAEEFARCKPDLPEAGRWQELHEGRPVIMQPPDDSHTTTVFNLTRALAEWFQTRQQQKVGYACHEIGLHVGHNPDTVYCPAISYFATGQQFRQTDHAVADEVPALVVDVASANDRRSEMRRRTLAYLALGVDTVWVPDPKKKEIQVIGKNQQTLALGQWQTLEGSPLLPSFAIEVKQVFAQPKWWR